MLRSLGEWVGVALLFAAFTALVTWPQAAVWDTHAYDHHDALFSMWRLSWIAEALTTHPSRLFDAPIFHPAPRTFAFSDAVLLQGLTALPALLAGASPLPVYNLLLLAGPWLSAIGTYLLVRSLLAHLRPEEPSSSSFWPALIAGTIFGLLPYRIDHLMHLELQWSQWMPLSCWAINRTVWHGRTRDGVLAAVFVLAQFLSCIYYGIFLVVALAGSAPLLLLARQRASIGRIARSLAVGAAVIVLPLAAYSAPYRANQQALGTRDAWEIDTWSARPASFVSAPATNRVYGWTAEWTLPEGRLMPGALAATLAAAGLWGLRRRRETWMYVAVLVLSALLALGTHTAVYRVVLAVVPPLRGLRAPGRFGMVMALAVAVLAGLGAAWLLARAPRRWRHAAGAAVVAVLLVEYASEAGPLKPWVQRPPVYAMYLRAQPPGVVVEFPVPRTSGLPLHDPEWSYLGRFHRHPLVNGYSGYYPKEYLRLLDTLVRFPRGTSLDELRARDVRYIVLHEDRYDGADFLDFDARLRRTPGLRFLGRIPDQNYPVTIYALE